MRDRRRLYPPVGRPTVPSRGPSNCTLPWADCILPRRQALTCAIAFLSDRPGPAYGSLFLLLGMGSLFGGLMVGYESIVPALQWCYYGALNALQVRPRLAVVATGAAVVALNALQVRPIVLRARGPVIAAGSLRDRRVIAA